MRLLKYSRRLDTCGRSLDIGMQGALTPVERTRIQRIRLPAIPTAAPAAVALGDDTKRSGVCGTAMLARGVAPKVGPVRPTRASATAAHRATSTHICRLRRQCNPGNVWNAPGSAIPVPIHLTNPQSCVLKAALSAEGCPACRGMSSRSEHYPTGAFIRPLESRRRALRYRQGYGNGLPIVAEVVQGPKNFRRWKPDAPCWIQRHPCSTRQRPQKRSMD